jgi:hypothetical protein
MRVEPNARLRELIVLLGCEDKIAPMEDKAFDKRAGNLIAWAATKPMRPKRTDPARARALRNRSRRL